MSKQNIRVSRDTTIGNQVVTLEIRQTQSTLKGLIDELSLLLDKHGDIPIGLDDGSKISDVSVTIYESASTDNIIIILG